MTSLCRLCNSRETLSVRGPAPAAKNGVGTAPPHPSVSRAGHGRRAAACRRGRSSSGWYPASGPPPSHCLDVPSDGNGRPPRRNARGVPAADADRDRVGADRSVRRLPAHPRLAHGGGRDPRTETLLAQLLNRPEWHQRAACRGADPDLFFPDPSSGRPVRALAYCDGCQVRPECLAIALDAGSHSDVGVWGGTSLRQRRVLRRGSVA